ncbi:MAG: nucleotidyltransferase domain-containing protein [Vulcanimicrobiaceae bacterium]
MIDWSTVPYPPWWIERAAQRRIRLGSAVARLRAVVAASDDIVGALVFGSYALGRVGPESDLDVMLVTREPANGDSGARYARLVERLALGVPCDLLVYEEEEFRRLARERPFVAQALREGLWIDATSPP